jgi:hypothetical protein
MDMTHGHDDGMTFGHDPGIWTLKSTHGHGH